MPCHQDELILFSPQYQFRFNAAETVLTPKATQITVLTQFEVDVNVRPQLAGGGTYARPTVSFRSSNSVSGGWYGADGKAQDLTGYVSAFVPNQVSR